jgi:hypothetical protein
MLLVGLLFDSNKADKKIRQRKLSVSYNSEEFHIFLQHFSVEKELVWLIILFLKGYEITALNPFKKKITADL